MPLIDLLCRLAGGDRRFLARPTGQPGSRAAAIVLVKPWAMAVLMRGMGAPGRQCSWSARHGERLQTRAHLMMWDGTEHTNIEWNFRP